MIWRQIFSTQSKSFPQTTYVAEGTTIPKPRISDNSLMVAKVMIESGYQPGIGLARQGEIKPVKLKKTVDRYGLGYKPTKQNKKRIAAEKQEKKLARLEGKDPVSPGLGEVPHISATFPKPAYVYQPQPFFFDEDEEEQYSEKVEELLVLAKKSRELKEVFEYYDIPEEAGHFIRAYKLKPSKTVQSLRFTVLFVQPLPEKGSKAGRSPPIPLPLRKIIQLLLNQSISSTAKASHSSSYPAFHPGP